jgi:hypothetical protein
LKEKRFGSKSNKSFTFDFAGRRIIDEKIDINFKTFAKDVEDIIKLDSNTKQTNDLVNQDIKMTPRVIIFRVIIIKSVTFLIFGQLKYFKRPVKLNNDL